MYAADRASRNTGGRADGRAECADRTPMPSPSPRAVDSHGIYSLVSIRKARTVFYIRCTAKIAGIVLIFIDN